MADIKRRYTVSKDKSGVYYAHMRGYPNIPVMGSLGTRKEATEYARMMDNMPNKVSEIEARKLLEFEESLSQQY